MISVFRPIVAIAIALSLGACSSSKPDPAPKPEPPAPIKIDNSGPSLAGDAERARGAAELASGPVGAEMLKARAESALGKEIPNDQESKDKRSEMIDKATEAAREKAKEYGKEDDLEKARDALRKALGNG